MPAPPAIAVDGPAASGKTVAGRLLARRLGYRFLDTGAMYRAVTLLALQKGVPLEDAPALSRIATDMDYRDVEPETADMSPRVVVNGRDVTDEVRGVKVDRAVSQVSAIPGVRNALVRLQQGIAREGKVVMVGRDIGTVVLPDARLKVYLDASARVRARRRYIDLTQAGVPARYEDVLADIQRRDKLDSEREMSPLLPAADAHRIDTDNYTIDEVVEKLWRLTEGQ